MSSKPKITGAGFNTFAIISLFVLLPFSVASITNYSSVTEDQPFDNLTEGDVNVEGSSINRSGFFWSDIGANLTNSYISDPANSFNTFGTDDFLDPYYCMWKTETETVLPYTSDGRTYCHIYQDSSYQLDRVYDYNGERWLSVGQTHSWVNIAGNNDPYIGTSGNDFSFELGRNFFHNLEDRDLGYLQVKIQDPNTGWVDIYNSPRTNITFDYSITFVYDSPIAPSIENSTTNPDPTTIKFDGFEYEGDNIQCGIFDPYKFGTFTGCYSGININFGFSSLEIVELSNWMDGKDISLLTAIVEIANADDSEVAGTGLQNAIIPFGGVEDMRIQVNVKYSNSQQINFIMKGGAFILGAGLFFLAVASTPYYDPVKNFFKGAQ